MAKIIANTNIPRIPSVNKNSEELSRKSLATPAPIEIIKATIKPRYVLMAPISSFISSIHAILHIAYFHETVACVPIYAIVNTKNAIVAITSISIIDPSNFLFYFLFFYQQ